jgi:hypothetical protein
MRECCREQAIGSGVGFSERYDACPLRQR